MTIGTEHKDGAGIAIDVDSVEAEFFAGSRRVDPRTHDDDNGSDPIDFAHIVMTSACGRDWYERSILKGEREEQIVAVLKTSGVTDAQCCHAGRTTKGKQADADYIREMSQGG